MQFKSYEQLISGFFHLIFLVYTWLKVTETTERETTNRDNYFVISLMSVHLKKRHQYFFPSLETSVSCRRWLFFCCFQLPRCPCSAGPSILVIKQNGNQPLGELKAGDQVYLIFLLLFRRKSLSSKSFPNLGAQCQLQEDVTPFLLFLVTPGIWALDQSFSVRYGVRQKSAFWGRQGGQMARCMLHFFPTMEEVMGDPLGSDLTHFQQGQMWAKWIFFPLLEMVWIFSALCFCREL